MYVTVKHNQLENKSTARILFWLGCLNLTHTRITQEERTTVEKMPSSDWTVGKWGRTFS